MTLCLPLLDTGLSIARRFLRDEPIFRADRGHIHHRLLDRGLTPRHVTLLLYAAGFLGAMFSLLQSDSSNRVRLVVICAFAVTVCVGINYLGYQEFGVAARLVRRKAIRSMVKTELSLSVYEKLLNSVKTADECWCTLKTASNELGFSEIELKLGGREYREQFRESSSDSWSFQVPLSESEYVRFLCHFEFGAMSVHVAPWADLLHRCLRSRILIWTTEGEASSSLASPELERI